MPGSLVFGGGGDSSCATQTGTPDFVEAIAMGYDLPRLSCILGMAFGVSRSVVVVVVVVAVVWVVAGRLRDHRPARSGRGVHSRLIAHSTLSGGAAADAAVFPLNCT